MNERLLNVSYSNEEALTWLLESLNVFFMSWWTEGRRWGTSGCYKLPDCWIALTQKIKAQALYGAALVNKHTGGK